MCQEYSLFLLKTRSPNSCNSIEISSQSSQLQLALVRIDQFCNTAEEGRVFTHCIPAPQPIRGVFLSCTINTLYHARQRVEPPISLNQIFSTFSLQVPTFFLSLKLAHYTIHNSQDHTILCVQESFNWYQEPWFHPRIGGFSDLQVVYVFYGQFESLVTYSLILIFFRCLILCFLVLLCLQVLQDHCLSLG